MSTRTIEQALAPYGRPAAGQYTPGCSQNDGNQARWVILYPGDVAPLALCFTHYEQWRELAESNGSLGREARILD